MIFQPNIVKVGSSTTPEGWYPPADWGWDAADELIANSDNGFVGLVAIYPNIGNYSAFLLTFSGTASVDWGDGVIESLTSGVKITHQYNYSAISSAITTEGYKVVRIYVAATSTVSVINFEQAHANEKSYLGNWLAIKLRSQYATPTVILSRMENAAIIDVANIHGVNMRFDSKYNLQRLIFDPDGRNFGNNLFSNSVIHNYNFSLYDWSGMLDGTQIFHVTYSMMPQVFNASIPLCQSLYFAFRICYVFRVVKLQTSSALTNLYGTFNANDSIRDIEITDCSGVTDTTAFVSGANVERLILTGLTIGVSVANCNLSATAINAFLTALGNANGTQTINLAGNPGALTCDVSIGTAKGYIIITA